MELDREIPDSWNMPICKYPSCAGRLMSSTNYCNLHRCIKGKCQELRANNQTISGAYGLCCHHVQVHNSKEGPVDIFREDLPAEPIIFYPRHVLPPKPTPNDQVVAIFEKYDWVVEKNSLTGRIENARLKRMKVRFDRNSNVYFDDSDTDELILHWNSRKERFLSFRGKVVTMKDLPGYIELMIKDGGENLHKKIVKHRGSF